MGIFIHEQVLADGQVGESGAAPNNAQELAISRTLPINELAN